MVVSGEGSANEVQLQLNKMSDGIMSDSAVIEFDFVSDSTSANIMYLQASPQSGSLFRLQQTSAGSMRIASGGTGETAATTYTAVNCFFAGTKHHVKFVIDYVNQVGTMYFDGDAVIENHKFMAVSYTHLDVYKRQGLPQRRKRG